MYKSILIDSDNYQYTSYYHYSTSKGKFTKVTNFNFF